MLLVSVVGYFSPHCPECNMSDEVIIPLRTNYRYDTFYCKRCKRTFKSNEGYPHTPASIYRANGSSVNSWAACMQLSSRFLH